MGILFEKRTADGSSDRSIDREQSRYQYEELSQSKAQARPGITHAHFVSYEMLHTFEDIKNLANSVRDIDLKAVLQRTGCHRDTSDKAKWHTPRGVTSVTGQKFMNWIQGSGGGGAIDLVMHLKDVDFITAVLWLSENFATSGFQTLKKQKPILKTVFTLPKRDDNQLPWVKRYLIHGRGIPPTLIHSLIRSGKIYADHRGNAVFLLLGKEKRVVGAELRGTTFKRWHGLAPGSRKDLGCFYVKNTNIKKAVICESAIDAISFFALHSDWLVLSTAGVNPNPEWLAGLVDKGFPICCGFDADKTGDAFADKMINLYPTVKRLRPPKHDWNKVLKSSLPLS
jgi:hypothetical protein